MYAISASPGNGRISRLIRAGGRRGRDSNCMALARSGDCVPGGRILLGYLPGGRWKPRPLPSLDHFRLLLPRELLEVVVVAAQIAISGLDLVGSTQRMGVDPTRSMVQSYLEMFEGALGRGDQPTRGADTGMHRTEAGQEGTQQPQASGLQTGYRSTRQPFVPAYGQWTPQPPQGYQ